MPKGERLFAENIPGPVTVSATTWTLCFASRAKREWALVVNQGGQDITLYLGNAIGPPAAAKLSGVHLLAAGGWVIFDKAMPWNGAIYAIADGAIASAVTGVEVYME